MGEIKKRIISGIFIAPVIASFFYFLPLKWFFVFLSCVAVIAIFELVIMADLRERYLILFLTMISFIPLYQRSLNTYILWLIFSTLIYMVIKFLKGESIRENINRDTIKGIHTLIMCEIFIVLPLFYMYLLKEIGNTFPLVFLCTIWASDTNALFIGKTFGKNPLVPRISPKKTFEGLGGAVSGSMLIMLFTYRITRMTMVEALIIGGIIGVLAQFGDIFESMAKRVCETKDSSSLIPGHGGLLDKFDSFIFTTPFLYHYLSGIKG